MKNRRDLIILAGLFLALILFVVLGPRVRPTPTEPDIPTTRSSAGTGALALYNWLGQVGYDVRRLEYRAFELDEGDAALVVLNPTTAINQAHIDTILEWVDRGGTLILADDSALAFSASDELLDQIDVYRDVYSGTLTIDRAYPAQPVLDQPPTGELVLKTGRVLVPQTQSYVKLAGPRGADVVIGMKRGQGYIFLSSATYPLTNAGLRDANNAALVLNMLRRVPKGGRIQFDEYHLGFFTPPSPSRVLLGSPLGWAAAYALLATGLYLLLSGRRFGRPVPVKEELARRSSAEYVESMADLLQRAGQRGYILKHYHTVLKRRLAAPAGISPQLDDPAFVRELARFRQVDEQALLTLLGRLRSSNISEAELVRAVAQVHEILAERV
jgi:hypothetical protein